MRHHSIFTLPILTILFWGCAVNSNHGGDYIREMVGSKLVINTGQMTIGDDSMMYLSHLDKQFKIVVYSDSSNCTACNIQFPAWKIKFRELSLVNNDVGLIFITNTDNISGTEAIANISRPSGLRLYDAQGVFKKNNHVFSHTDFHIFLVDRDNKVILIGNPLTNHRIFALYKEAIEVNFSH